MRNKIGMIAFIMIVFSVGTLSINVCREAHAKGELKWVPWEVGSRGAEKTVTDISPFANNGDWGVLINFANNST